MQQSHLHFYFHILVWAFYDHIKIKMEKLFDMYNVPEIYKDFTPVSAPTICTMGITCDVPLVDSALCKVQAGSPLSH